MNTNFTLSITRLLGSTLLRGVCLCATLALNLPLLVNAATAVTGPGASVEGAVEFGEPLSGTATFQYIILGSDLTAVQNQTIRGIAFRADSNNDPVAPAYGFASLKISVGSTALSTLNGASTTFATNNAGATTTYDGAFYYTNPLPGGGAPNAFGDVIYFTTPYAYTTGNLIITISHSTNVKQSDGTGAVHPGTADAYTNAAGTLFGGTATVASRWDGVSPVTAITTDADPSAPPPAPSGGQTLQVTPDAINYSAAGGTVSYEVVVNYTGTPSALGLRVIPPADWTYTSTTGTNAPICLDAIGAKQGSNDEGFGWFYFTAPASPARFTVKFTYPAGQTGDKAVLFAALCYDSTGPAVTVTPTVAVPALLAPPAAPTAPTITTQPVSATLLAGATANFSVVATGTGPLTYQWSKAGKAIVGATNNSYAISSIVIADSGSFTVTVTNAKGAVTSSAAVLLVSESPKIATQPKATNVVPGGTFTLSAQATSAAPLAYQWYFNNVLISGATQSTYSATGVTGANTGYYKTKITNSVDSTGVTSTDVLVQVSPAGTTATHQAITTSGRGYPVGGTLRITNTIAFPTAATALGWTVMLPTGFSLASDTTGANSKPLAGTTTKLDWAWDAGAVTTPLTFTYTVNVPSNATGTKVIGAFAFVRVSGDTLPIICTPDPLSVAQEGLPHSTDTDGDWKISVDELAQTIALFNTVNGNVRTGAYKYVTSGSTGGFAADPSVAVVVSIPGNIHSADTNADGMIDLRELLQLIDLYNYRVGTDRTGSYHWQVDEAGTGADKYTTGP